MQQKSGAAAVFAAFTPATLAAANTLKAGDGTLGHLHALRFAFQPQQQLENGLHLPTQLHHKLHPKP